MPSTSRQSSSDGFSSPLPGLELGDARHDIGPTQDHVLVKKDDLVGELPEELPLPAHYLVLGGVVDTGGNGSRPGLLRHELVEEGGVESIRLDHHDLQTMADQLGTKRLSNAEADRSWTPQ
jgi:hypothetical protein